MRKNWIIICLIVLLGINNINASIIINNNIDINLTAINNSECIFNVTSPIDTIYYKKKVDFRIVSDILLNELDYVNLNDKDPRWKNLCDGCKEYGISRNKRLTFLEGKNQIVIRGNYNSRSNVSYYLTTFYVDSNVPTIFKTTPRVGEIINGSDLSIEYTSENLQNITLVYGEENLMKNVLGDCKAGKKQECHFNIDLSEYNDKEIKYKFILKDLVYTIETELRKIRIDTIDPVITINNPRSDYNNIRIVPFNITVSEKSTIQFKDNSDKNPVFRTLCTNCLEYGFFKKRTQVFQIGLHELEFKSIDKAGNIDLILVNTTSE